jgi:hypothetical protein
MSLSLRINKKPLKLKNDCSKYKKDPNAGNVRKSYVDLHKKIDQSHASTVDHLVLGNIYLDRLSKVSAKIYNLHKNMAMEIVNILNEEAEKIQKENSKLNTAAAFDAFEVTYKKCFDSWKSVATSYYKFSEKGLENSKGLEESSNKIKDTITEIAKKEKIAMSMAERIHTNMEKSKSKHQKKLERLLGKEYGNLSTAINMKEMKAEMNAASKAMEAVDNYVGNLESANKAFSALREAELFPLLDKFNSVIRYQNEGLIKFWQSGFENVSTMSQALNGVSESLEKEIVLFKTDTSNNCLHTTESLRLVLKSRDEPFYSYELPTDFETLQIKVKSLNFKLGAPDEELYIQSPDEVKDGDSDPENDGNLRSEVKPLTIPEVIERERELLKVEADEPIIISRLLDKIKELNGLKAEGIFRISSDYVLLKKFKDEIDRFQYDLSGVNSPHLAADLLKSWIRKLRDPVISQDLYENCLAVGISYQSSEEKENLFAQIASIVEKMSPPSVKIIGRISGFIEAAVSQENATSRMSVETFAILFAPALLRPPSDDLLSALANNGKETAFTCALFEYFIHSGQAIP